MEQREPSATPQTADSVRIDLQNEETAAAQSGPFRGNLSRYVLQRPIQYDIVSILFTLLVFAGGIYGYLSKGSSASLISGTLFAILLAFGTYFEGSRKNAYPLIVVLLILTATMAYRFSLTSKFMPAGLMAALSFIMLSRHCFLLYLRKRQQQES